MGLAKKGSRKIHVGETDYRWVVSGDSGFMVVVVEGARGDGQRLSVGMDYGNQTSTSGATVQGVSVTPALVRTLILDALAFGWRPDKRGRELCLWLDKDVLVR